MFKTPQELVKGVDKLVSLPEVCFLVNDLVNDPTSDIQQIGNVISQDPDLTARLLKLVNSSFYGYTTPIDTVSRAIMVVGLRELQHMVWASSAVETFNSLPPADATMASFWRHSIFTAVCGRILAREANILHPERLFVTGLLHDIGRLLIYIKEPDVAREVFGRQQQDPNQDLCIIEKNLLGFDHAELGGVLCESWQLPASISVAIANHHQPVLASGYPMESSIVHIANIMAHALELGQEEKLQELTHPGAWGMLDLSDNIVKKILHEAVLQFLEVLELLLPAASQRV